MVLHYIILHIQVFFFLSSDGEYGALFGRVRRNALRYNDNVQSIYGSCFCNLRSKIFSSPSSHLDEHSQASHWLFRDPAHVRKFLSFFICIIWVLCLWLDIDSFVMMKQGLCKAVGVSAMETTTRRE